jgi:hypothetical protein
VFVQITVTITTVGTAAGYITATLPGTSVTGAIYVLSGAESNATGKACRGLVTSASGSVLVAFYDNTFPGASGNIVSVSGVYESA